MSIESQILMGLGIVGAMLLLMVVTALIARYTIWVR